MAVVLQFNAGILLGVMGTDVPLSDFLDIISEYKVPVIYTHLLVYFSKRNKILLLIIIIKTVITLVISSSC